MSNTDSQKPTHVAYAYRREGKKFGRLLECGTARFDTKNRAIIHVAMDRLPIGSWSGYIVLSPQGAPPPDPLPPLDEPEDEDAFED